MGASHRRRVPRARSRAVRRCTARLVAVTATLLVVVAATFAVPVARASAADGTGWEPPVPGGVQRGFVEPASDYETGHRGVDFAAAPGTPVRAAGGGTVTFAGDVAGALHVVVLHRNALRTSYSFLLDVTVTTGDRVDAGTVIGHAGGVDAAGTHVPGVLHFGLRVGAHYVDPLQLFRARDLAALVRLVPVDDPLPSGSDWAHRAVDEAGDLARAFAPAVGPPVPLPTPADTGGCGDGVPLIGPVVHAACAGIDWASRETREALRAGLGVLAAGGRRLRALATRLEPVFLHALDELRTAARRAQSVELASQVRKTLTDVVEIGRRVLEWTRRECGSDTPPADGTHVNDHLLMAVGGLDSFTHADGSSFGLDADALGYDAADVSWFSYAEHGGAYTKDDTEGGLRKAAKRLGEQLIALHQREPDRVIDLVAHSQGGVVVDYFLAHRYDASDPRYPRITNVVTLATPHQGAPLAASNEALRGYSPTRDALDATDEALDQLSGDRRPIPRSGAKAVRQLAPGSRFMRDLWSRSLPSHTRLTTIGGTDDFVVPANRIRVPGATEVVLDIDGVSDHTSIVHDPAAMQAVRAALEHEPPPCTSVLTGLRAAVEPVLLDRVESDFGENAITALEARKWLN